MNVGHPYREGSEVRFSEVKFTRRSYIVRGDGSSVCQLRSEGFDADAAHGWEIESIVPCPAVGWLVILKKELPT